MKRALIGLGLLVGLITSAYAHSPKVLVRTYSQCYSMIGKIVEKKFTIVNMACQLNPSMQTKMAKSSKNFKSCVWGCARQRSAILLLDSNGRIFIPVTHHWRILRKRWEHQVGKVIKLRGKEVLMGGTHFFEINS